MNAVTRMQEGGIGVEAPGIDKDPVDLLSESGLGTGVLQRLHSCHVGDRACGACPGCRKNSESISRLMDLGNK